MLGVFVTLGERNHFGHFTGNSCALTMDVLVGGRPHATLLAGGAHLYRLATPTIMDGSLTKVDRLLRAHAVRMLLLYNFTKRQSILAPLIAAIIL
ncbi:hypothetical protein Hypma_016041 [Hypsizygus marmoreus]|uniref:Uncharacterized protein n=1 Tax=Hypsizygus marmoreus TaxID=39966 RepID=A0A369KDX9_HYPMA|nr:hypothetical protein Hypma_016041 [Hypsizygus marmoreus]